MTDSKKTKRKVAPGRVELADEEDALIVHFTVHETAVDDRGDVVSSGKYDDQKKIPVNISDGVPLEEKAQEIVDNERKVSSNKFEQVRKLLYELQQRKRPTTAPSTSGRTGRGQNKAPVPPLDVSYTSQRPQSRGATSPQASPTTPALTSAREDPSLSMGNIDDYMENLYEENVEVRTRATSKIAYLASRQELLPQLVEKNALMRALGRTLRDDYMRSVDTSFNVCFVFFVISHFSDLHSLILENQVGDGTVKAIEWEEKRIETWESEKQQESKQTEKKRKGIQKKQDRFFFVSTTLLLHLAESQAVERKMKKRNIVNHLCFLLDRSDLRVLEAAITFLKKLSIYFENKDRMAQCGVAEKLAKIISSTAQESLISVTLRLLLNLSFDANLRESMIRSGVLPPLISLMRSPSFEVLATSVLYNLSYEDRAKPYFKHYGAISHIRNKLTEAADMNSTPEVASLAVRLAQDPENAAALGEGELFDRVMEQAFERLDSLCFKLVRNISEHTGGSMRFQKYVERMARCLADPSAMGSFEEELMAMLANMKLPQFGLEDLVRQYNLIPFVLSRMRLGRQAPNRVVEAIMFIGSITCEELAGDLATRGAPQRVHAALADGIDDDDIVKATAWAFGRMAMHKETRTALLADDEGIHKLVSILAAGEGVPEEVLCGLDAIADCDDGWAGVIRSVKFEVHNVQWLEAVFGERTIPKHLLARYNDDALFSWQP